MLYSGFQPVRRHEGESLPAEPCLCYRFAKLLGAQQKIPVEQDTFSSKGYSFVTKNSVCFSCWLIEFLSLALYFWLGLVGG